MTARRLMTGREAAAYCGVTSATFSKWVAAGIVPSPLPGTRRWDRKAIDHALDMASGISPASEEPEDAFEKWKREDAARKAVERATPEPVRIKKDGTPAKKPGPLPSRRG